MLVLDRAFSIPSGVMSTRDKMLAKAGLCGVPLEAADWPVGVVGVPGDGRGDGVGAARTIKTECKFNGTVKKKYTTKQCV